MTGKRTRWMVAEAGLWIAGIAILASLASGALQARAAQSEAQTIRVADSTAVSKKLSPLKPDAVIGHLEIPKIALSVPVVGNYDPASLVKGVGYIPGSATPGGLGNLVLAGHRDTYFRALRHIQQGMEIEVSTSAGRFEYVVDSTEVVNPDAVNVMEVGDRPGMTLITCYPFEYIGAAPQRFIVHAHLVSDPA